MANPVSANFAIERVQVNHVDLVASLGKRPGEIVRRPDSIEIRAGVGIHEPWIVVEKGVAQLHVEFVNAVEISPNVQPSTKNGHVYNWPATTLRPEVRHAAFTMPWTGIRWGPRVEHV
jgi:hypothetical protein